MPLDAEVGRCPTPASCIQLVQAELGGPACAFPHALAAGRRDRSSQAAHCLARTACCSGRSAAHACASASLACTPAACRGITPPPARPPPSLPTPAEGGDRGAGGAPPGARRGRRAARAVGARVPGRRRRGARGGAYCARRALFLVRPGAQRGLRGTGHHSSITRSGARPSPWHGVCPSFAPVPCRLRHQAATSACHLAPRQPNRASVLSNHDVISGARPCRPPGPLHAGRHVGAGSGLCEERSHRRQPPLRLSHVTTRQHALRRHTRAPRSHPQST